MTGAGSGYIDNGYFPFIEARSVPFCTVTIQPESNPFITF